MRGGRAPKERGEKRRRPGRSRKSPVSSDAQHRPDPDRLFAMFEDSPMSVSLLQEPEMRVTTVNRESGLAVGANVVGKTIRELYPSDSPILRILDQVY